LLPWLNIEGRARFATFGVLLALGVATPVHLAI
jgi:hypothetical protein